MGKISRHGGASHAPRALRETAAVEREEPVVDESGPDEVDLATAGHTVQEVPEMQIPRGNASHADWARFVRHQNPPFDPETKGRDELRDWWHNMHGSPEDEPEAAGDADGGSHDDGPPAGAAAASGGDGADTDEGDDEDE